MRYKVLNKDGVAMYVGNSLQTAMIADDSHRVHHFKGEFCNINCMRAYHGR